MRAMPPRSSGETRLDRNEVLALLRTALYCAVAEVRACWRAANGQNPATRTEAELDLEFFRDAIDAALQSADDAAPGTAVPFFPTRLPNPQILKQLRRRLLRQLQGIQS